jgi:hypothetical protein
MQHGGDIPATPRWFLDEVAALFALYPSAQLASATGVAWWRHLHHLPAEALSYAFSKAPSQSAQWCPSAQVVREIAEAYAKTTKGPRPDLSRAALPEPDPELPDGHPLREGLERIKARTKAGELRGEDVMRAVVGLVTGGDHA